MMNWKNLEKIEQLAEIDSLSEQRPVLIFKHSTRCSVSAAALDRLERQAGELPTAANFYLDLITYRSVSNEVANRYATVHESPQALIIRNGKAVHVTSHFDINWTDLKQAAEVN
jgi:bacillithiol system protein YtxJ